MPQAVVRMNVARTLRLQLNAVELDEVFLVQRNVLAVAHSQVAVVVDQVLAQAVDEADAKCNRSTFQNTSTLTR